MTRRSRHHFLIVLFMFGIEAQEVVVTQGRSLRSYGRYRTSLWNHTLLGCNQKWCTTPGKSQSFLNTVFPQQGWLWAVSIRCCYHSYKNTSCLKWWMWNSPRNFYCLPLRIGDGIFIMIVWGQSVSYFLLYLRSCHHFRARSLLVFGVQKFNGVSTAIS